MNLTKLNMEGIDMNTATQNTVKDFPFNSGSFSPAALINEMEKIGYRFYLNNPAGQRVEGMAFPTAETRKKKVSQKYNLNLLSTFHDNEDEIWDYIAQHPEFEIWNLAERPAKI